MTPDSTRRATAPVPPQNAGFEAPQAPTGWWRLASPGGLTALFVVGVAVRLVLAPRLGFYGDLRYFRTWAGGLQDRGLRHFYSPDEFVDYPPGYLYVLWLLGRIQHSPSYLLLKLPVILGDLALAWFGALLAERLSPADLRRRIPIRPIVIAAVLFNPAILGVGAVWGQVDSIPSALVIATLLLLLTGRRGVGRDVGAMAIFAVAIAIKPQSGFLAPILAYLLIRRYLLTRQNTDRLRGLAQVIFITTVSGGLWAISGLPFGLGPKGLLNFYEASANSYPVTSANAFNFWGLVGFFRPDSDAPWKADTSTVHVFGLNAQTFGMVAFVLCVVVVLWLTHAAIARGLEEGRVIVASAAATNLVAFTMLTRMHERYMFPVLACLAPLVMWRGFRAAYWTFSVLFVINLWYPFALYNGQWNAAGSAGRVYGLATQPWFGWLFGDLDATNTGQRKFWSLVVLVVAIVFVTSCLQWVENARPVNFGGLPRFVVATRRRLRPPALDEAEATRIARVAPRLIVGAACLFGLLTLRSELRPARTVNDSTFHQQMIRWASGQLSHGRLPLDGWFPDLSAGSSFFHHYQSLPYTATAVAGRVTHVDPQTSYLWAIYLLLALWPISVYWGARLLGWGRWVAAGAAVVSPLVTSVPGYGYEYGSYTFQGLGVFTQLWGMWLLPLTLGLMWRAVHFRRGYALAALSLALTIATHLMTGYLAVLCLPVLGLLSRHQFLARLRRTALIGLGGLVTAGWVLVPLLADKKYSAQSVFYKGTIYNDSYGAGKILGWLFRGEIYDGHHVAVISLLVAAGFIACVLNFDDERSRVLIGVWVVSLLLFFGRATWGRATNVLPGGGDLQMHRFIVGVHLAGILMAGVGLVAFGRLLAGWLAAPVSGIQGRRAAVDPGARAKPVIGHWVGVVMVALFVLSPAWRHVWHDSRDGAGYIEEQRVADATEGQDVDALIQIAKSRGGGRIYAGTRANWGSDYTVGFVPVLQQIGHNDGDGIGFTFRTVQALTTDIEASFDDTNLAQYEMLNVRYILAPDWHLPSVPATLVATRGRNSLYEVATTGYIQVVDRIGSIAADRVDIDAATSVFRNSDSASRNEYPGIAFAGAEAAPPTVSSAPDTSPGAVITQSNVKQDGYFAASVIAKRRAVVLLKASYDPRWRVTVDGQPAKTVMMAPSFVGVDVDTGQHTVVFSYRAYPHYPELIAIAVLTLLALAAWPRRQRLLATVRSYSARRNAKNPLADREDGSEPSSRPSLPRSP